MVARVFTDRYGWVRSRLRRDAGSRGLSERTEVARALGVLGVLGILGKSAAARTSGERLGDAGSDGVSERTEVARVSLKY